MRRPLLSVVVVASVLAGSGAARAQSDPAADAPDPRPRTALADPAPASYAEALRRWRRAEDINAWIEARFEYDGPRALQLSESARAGGAAPQIHEPAAFFERPAGVCVDLSRFAVETLRAIAPEAEPRYVMIEFDPVLRSGQVLRRHWIAGFRRGGDHYFFADSRYPGRIYGPYPSAQAFIAEYAELRHRPVIAWRELDSFRRQPKSDQARRSNAG